MRLPLIVACLIAGSTWSFASADALTSTSNPKTAQKAFSARPTQQAMRTPSNTGTQQQVDPLAKKQADAQQRYPLTPAEEAWKQKVQEKQAERDARAAEKVAIMKARAQQAKRAALAAAGISAPTSGSTTGRSQHHSLLAPSNDDCSTPITIAGPGPFGFDNTGSTTGVQLPVNCSWIGSDIWYVWNAPSSGNCTMTTCGMGGTLTDTMIAAYAGNTCPGGMELACNDDGCGGGFLSTIVFPVTAGSDYMLQVGGYFGATGTASFTMNVLPAVAGDDCASPVVISGAGTFLYDTTGATTSSQQGGIYPSANQDLWYEWTSPASGQATMTLCGLTGYDSVIKAYSGSGCPGGTPDSFDDDGCCPGAFACASVMNFPVTSGGVYMLQVGGFGALDYGPGGFTLSVAPPSPLDDCSLPAVISGNGAFAFDTTGMTTSPQLGWCGQASDDIWYTWTATSSGVAVIDTCGSSYDTLIAVFPGAGCPGMVAPMTCNDNGQCGGVYTNQSALTFPVTSGSTYTIEVGGWFYAIPNYGPGTLNINVIPPPANDDCTGSTVLTPGFGTFPFDSTAASTSIDGQLESLCSIYGLTAVTNDVWYQWTSTVTGQVSFETCGTTTVDTKIAVYPGAGCPAVGTALGCDDDACGLQSRVVFSATAGATYTLQLGTWPFGAPGGAGSFSLVDATPPANDDCATPTVVGLGSFPYDNSFATTGVDGQTESLCNFVGGTPIPYDTWFQFTAPAGGCTVIDDCGSFSHDSKISVYAGTGCPVAGTSIGCNDQGCGGQAQVRFTATAGQTYTIQLGSWALGVAGSGTLNISQPGAGVANDECATPTVIAGTGSFPFDNTLATTGCAGQGEALCAYYGNPLIPNDIWYQWMAPSSGYARLTTCGSGVDTKVAAYLGSGCPTAGSAVACNDDTYDFVTPCYYESTILWPVTAGATYMIQLGNYPFGGAPGSGSFDLQILTPQACDSMDDNTSENLWSLGGNSDTVWLNTFGAPGVTTTINSVDIMYGFALAPGNAPPNGTATDIMIYGDGLSQDGNPTDATLLAQVPSTVTNVDTDTYVTVTLPTPVTVTGIFFAGGHEFCVGGQWVAPNDTGSTWSYRSWEFGDNTGGTANLTNPGLSAFPPTSLNGSYLFGQGVFCVRVNCSFGPATYTCTPGDPGINLCPCSNPPTGANRGCNNKGVTGGASITGTGSNSLTTPTLTFTTANENASVGSVLIQGTAFNAGLTFGHGVRCAAGTVKRLFVKIAVGGSITAPSGLDPSIPAKSLALGNPILAGQLRVYQVYYRDTTVLLPGCPVPANQYNVTNAAQVIWTP